MRVFSTTIRRVTVSGGGGDIPPGAAVMTDSIALIATVFLGDTNTAPNDENYYELSLALAETADEQDEALTVQISGEALADILAEQSEDLLLSLSGFADTVAEQNEALLLSLSGAALADAIAAQAEAAQLAFSGLADSSEAPTDGIAADVTSWGTSTTTAGTAPTNTANATGSNNGTVSTCKAAGLPTPTASTLNVVIARGGVLAGGTKTILAYYSTNAGTGDTFTLTYTATGGTPVTLTLPEGNFLTTPHSAAITNIGASNDPVFTFTHGCLVAATGGSISVDACAIKSVGSF